MKNNFGYFWVGLGVYSILFVFWIALFNLQIVNKKTYEIKAERQATTAKKITAERGKILDRNGVLLADDLKIKNKHERLYLKGSLASQLIGKVGADNKGTVGLELKFDKELRGKMGVETIIGGKIGKLVYKRDSLGNVLKDTTGKPKTERKFFSVNNYVQSEVNVYAENGNNLILTIDIEMQDIVENALKKGVERYLAESGSAIVLDPYTGEILAAASYPTFDPNLKESGVGRETKCDIFSLVYEPGSTFKVVTAMSALEENIVRADSVFSGEGGIWTKDGLFKKDPIREHNGKDLGNMNMTEALAKSSNIVFAKIAGLIGSDNFYRFVRNAGFGSKTSNELPSEDNIYFRKPFEWDGRTLYTLGFGHAISVTPIQMTMVFAAVANGGYLMVPHILKEWQDSSGNTVQKYNPDTLRQIASESTTAKLKEMLLSVVASGTALAVNSKILEEMEFGGKTGTAEKIKADGKGYDRRAQYASFIGLAPALDPKYVCLVVLDEPKTRTAGGTAAGPIFREIMEGIYYSPHLSPKSFRLSKAKNERNCQINLENRNFAEVQKIAEKRNCHLNVQGEGEQIIAVQKIAGDTLNITLGRDRLLEMPDLKGLSLNEALSLLSKIHVQVEFTGKGQIIKQSPLPKEKLKRGQICSLILKEQV